MMRAVRKVVIYTVDRWNPKKLAESLRANAIDNETMQM